MTKDNNGPKKRNNLGLTIDVDLKNSYEELSTIEVEDGKAKTIIGSISLKKSFVDNLISLFKEKFDIAHDNIEISRISDQKGVNSSTHFIIHNKESDKKYHIKAALHGSGISLGSKFNEAAFYFLNDELKVGPRAEGIVTKEGMLMIITEDLQSRSIGNSHNQKEISFSDNERRDEDSKKIKKFEYADQIPERRQENIHRCVTEIVINLCFYADVQHNFANTGFKTAVRKMPNDQLETKHKPFIIDFRLSNETDLVKKYCKNDFYYEISKNDLITQYSKLIGEAIIGQKRDPLEKDIFNFDEDPAIFQAAVKKLFLDENTGSYNKFNLAIENAFKKASIIIPDNQYKKDHLSVLRFQKGQIENHLSKFLSDENIKNFLEQESKKIIDNKRSPSNNPQNPTSERPAKIARTNNDNDVGR